MIDKTSLPPSRSGLQGTRVLLVNPTGSAGELTREETAQGERDVGWDGAVLRPWATQAARGQKAHGQISVLCSHLSSLVQDPVIQALLLVGERGAGAFGPERQVNYPIHLNGVLTLKPFQCPDRLF